MLAGRKGLAKTRFLVMRSSYHHETKHWRANFRDEDHMIDLCYWTTPNGHKITMSIGVGETRGPDRIVPVCIAT